MAEEAPPRSSRKRKEKEVLRAKTAQIQDTPAAQEVRAFLEMQQGSALRAWLEHFDTSHDYKVSQEEFLKGMQVLGYEGDAVKLFNTLDRDHSGEITLEEIHQEQQLLWVRFRSWCVRRYASIDEMILSLNPEKGKAHFYDSLAKHDWTGSNEELLMQLVGFFFAEPGETRARLRWLELEHHRRIRREQAKHRALQSQHRRQQENAAARAQLTEFKRYLKSKYGSFVRAWRCALSPDDSMVLQKSEFLKACNRLNGWHGNAKLVWKVFDQDDSGLISIDELDPNSAEVLAHFRAFIMEKFGSPQAAFRAFDKDGSRTIKQAEFMEALKEHGFTHPGKQLFLGLDRHNEKKLVEENLLFLAKWKPLPFLTQQPNPQAMQEFKDLILTKYRSFMMAWRRLLDRDNSNRCNWQEFANACKKLGFTGDASGAWRALDSDLSGYISLHELDPTASDCLFAFKRWADEEFGGLRSAFSVFDSDGSRRIDYPEFHYCCRTHGFDGDTSELFNALDFQGDGCLSLHELSILDDWPTEEEPAAEPRAGGPGRRQSNAPRRQSAERGRPHTDCADPIASSGGDLGARRVSALPADLGRSATEDDWRAGPRGTLTRQDLPPSLQLLVKPRRLWRAPDVAVAHPLGSPSGKHSILSLPGEVNFEAVSECIRKQPRSGGDWVWWDAAVCADESPLEPRGTAAVDEADRRLPLQSAAGLPPVDGAEASDGPTAATGPPRQQQQPQQPRPRAFVTSTPRVHNADALLKAAYGARPVAPPRSPSTAAPPSTAGPRAPGPQSARGLGVGGAPLPPMALSRPPTERRAARPCAAPTWGAQEERLAARHAAAAEALAAGDALLASASGPRAAASAALLDRLLRAQVPGWDLAEEAPGRLGSAPRKPRMVAVW